MSSASDFVIENGVLKEYLGPGGDVVVPEGVTSIADSAFKGREKLTRVVIPEGVTKIGPSAFYSCRSLQEAVVPASLARIGGKAFRLCPNLTRLDIADIAAWCAVTTADEYSDPLFESGFGFGEHGRAPHKDGSLYLNGEELRALILPEGLTEITHAAFINCANIEEVRVPSSLRTVASNAFQGCKSVRTVHIQDLEAWSAVDFQSQSGWNSCGRSNPLFYGAALALKGETITELRLPGNMNKIGKHAFNGCGSITSVVMEEGITEIGSSAFENCAALNRVSIPKTLQNSKISAFDRCKKLKTVQIEDLGAWLSVEFDTIWSSNPLENGADLLLNGEPVRELVIPEGVTSIGDSAFVGCTSLTSVTIPGNVTSIETRAFSECVNIVHVRIPEGVTSIGNNAFGGCARLETLTIPASMIGIGYSAFKGCESLRRVTLLASSAVIGGDDVWSSPFAGCKIDVWAPQWTKDTTKLLAAAELRTIHTDRISDVPSMYRALAALGFATEEKRDLSTTRAAEHMAFLKKHAAKLCRQMMDYPAAVYFLCEQKLLPAAAVDEYMKEAEERNNVELKARLLSYQNELGHASLTKARAKKEKTREDYEDALLERMASRDLSKGIEGLTFVITGKLSYTWRTKAEVKAYLESYGATLGTSVTKQTDYLVMTNEADDNSEKSRKARDYGALVISEGEFNEMAGLRYRDAPHVTIPAWVKSIPERAFYHNKSLISVTIPEGVTSIGKHAFSFCENLPCITFPQSLKKIDYDAFYCCKKLKEIHISDLEAWCQIDMEAWSAVFEFDRSLYLNGQELRDLVIPKSVKCIKKRSFEHFENIMSVTIPEGMSSIGEFAFASCSSLTSVTIPASVTGIGYGAFFFCRQLTIHAPAGSYAEQYAKENKISFVAE